MRNSDDHRSAGRIHAVGRIGPGLAAAVCAGSVLAAPPSKIVVVIEENHSLSQIIGSPSAPFMNMLAGGGALCTSFYAITHPSQPNYLHLFSGASQGVTGDGVPSGTPFSTANLAASLIASGGTFGGYCEGLPGVGSNIASSGNYYRKHNPWVNWQKDPPGANQLPSAINMPFSMFPADFAQLPSLSIVVPDQQHDMHDGTIAQADAWLSQYIGPYATWAMNNNGLLIITWDEDASNERNRIPTILYGPMVRQGQVSTSWSLHDLQRTIAELLGAPASGSAARCRRLIGAFGDDRAVATVTLRDGLDAYAGTRDTYIESAAGSTEHSAASINVADGSPLSQCLIRFDAIIGAGTGQVPAGAHIHAAKLLILTGSTSGDQAANDVSLHRMLIDWPETATWNSLGGGVSADGSEAVIADTFTLFPNTADTWVMFDVTADVQGYADATGANHGWAILPTGTDGWRWKSSETAVASERPRLEITYWCPADFDGSGFVDIEDYTAFVLAFEAGTDDADFDGTGFVDTEDFDAFVGAFERGC